MIAPLNPTWVAAALGFPRGWAQCQCLGVYEGAEPVAGFVFHNWEPQAGVIEVTAYALSPKWATRANLRALFSYPFDQCGCQMVVARTGVDNRFARRLWQAFGAAEYVIPRLNGRNNDGVLYTLTAEQWAKSRINHGKAKRTQAA